MDRKKESCCREIRFVTKNNEFKWVEVFARPTFQADGTIIGVSGTLTDITERKKAESTLRDSEERYRRLVELSPDAILVYSEGKIVLVNGKAVNFFKAQQPDDLLGRMILDVVHPDSHIKVIQHTEQLYMNKGMLPPTEKKYVCFDGSVVIVETSSAFIIFNGKPATLVIFRDITERKITEKKLQEANHILHRLSNMDGLTGIGNRRYFDEYLEREWKRAVRNGKPLSLIMLDIDFFKTYNDTYGHIGGDACLRRVAKTIDEQLNRPGDMAARYGGEEFVIILPETESSGALHVAETIRTHIEALAIPHVGSPVYQTVTCSVGTATFIPTVYATSKDLMEAADQALYRAKQLGRNQVIVYEKQTIGS